MAKPTHRSANERSTAALESRNVENTLKASVWKRADATVFSGGGQAPFCASEARQVFCACDISDDSSMPTKPKMEREKNPMSNTQARNFMCVYYRTSA